MHDRVDPDMETFRSVVLTGLFYERDDKVLIVPEEGDEADLDEHLEPFLGSQVKLVAHHLPPTPVDPERWGGGCCRWEPGDCPAGHHVNPTYLVLMAVEGELVRDEEQGWVVLREDGNRVIVPVGQLMGHISQIAVVTNIDLSKIEPDKGSLDDALKLGQELEQMLGSLSQLQGFMKKGPKE